MWSWVRSGAPGLHDSQGTRHAQMDYKPAAAGVKQEILGAALQVVDRTSGQALRQVFWYRPAQPGFAHQNRFDPTTDDVGKQSESRCLYLG